MKNKYSLTIHTSELTVIGIILSVLTYLNYGNLTSRDATVICGFLSLLFLIRLFYPLKHNKRYKLEKIFAVCGMIFVSGWLIYSCADEPPKIPAQLIHILIDR